MISQVLREDLPDSDPAPYIPTFYQFSDFIEHNPAADVSATIKMNTMGAKRSALMFIVYI